MLKAFAGPTFDANIQNFFLKSNAITERTPERPRDHIAIARL